MYGMEVRGRFGRPTGNANSVCGPEGPSFEDLLGMLYKVLRFYPEAREAVEVAFLEMSKRAKNGVQ